MSGTSSTTPPLDGWNAPLTPEQRKAHEAIGQALAAGDGIRIDSTRPPKFTNCTVHISDAQMLDWVLEHRARALNLGTDGYIAEYWHGRELRYGPREPFAMTPRAAILAAMKKEQPK